MLDLEKLVGIFVLFPWPFSTLYYFYTLLVYIAVRNIIYLVLLQTSLLMAILNEMNEKSGTLHVNGSISYVPQEAWVMSATLRYNVTMENDYDMEKYKNIIDATALAQVVYL